MFNFVQCPFFFLSLILFICFCPCWGSYLRHTGSSLLGVGPCRSREHRLNSCPMACGISVLQPGIEPTTPALECAFLTAGPLGSPQYIFEYHLSCFLFGDWYLLIFQCVKTSHSAFNAFIFSISLFLCYILWGCFRSRILISDKVY